MENPSTFIDRVAALRLARKALRKAVKQNNLCSKLKWGKTILTLEAEVDQMLETHYRKRLEAQRKELKNDKS